MAVPGVAWKALGAWTKLVPLAAVGVSAVVVSSTLPSLPTVNPATQQAARSAQAAKKAALKAGAAGAAAGQTPGAQATNSSIAPGGNGAGAVALVNAGPNAFSLNAGPYGGGGNGCVTYRGVDCHNVKVAFHWHTNPCGQDASALLAEIGVGNGDPSSSLTVLLPFFNSKAVAAIYPDFKDVLQTGYYGRQIYPVYEPEDGGPFCPDQNHSYAVKIAQTDQAFAAMGGCITCGSEGSGDEMDPVLASYGVLSVDWTQNSEPWYESGRPYIWSIATSGTRIVNQWIPFVCDYLRKKPSMNTGDPSTGSQTRVFSIGHVNQPEENNLADFLESQIKGCGGHFGANFSYNKDISTAAEQAATYLAIMRNSHTTTVIAFSDEVANLVGQQEEHNSNWHPEAITSNFAGGDSDIAGETYPQDEQKFVFGTGQGDTQEWANTKFCDTWYGRLWCQKYPGANNEPGKMPPADYIIWSYEMALLGRQILESGATLTPQHVRDGMFKTCAPCARLDNALPGYGPKYPDSQYSGGKDYQLIRWDSNHYSDWAAVGNSQGNVAGKGAYVPIGTPGLAGGDVFGDIPHAADWFRWLIWGQPS